MADSEIAGLTEDTTPDLTDNLYAQDAAGNVDKRVPLSALATLYQPLDSDLTAIAALATTAFGRALLTLADAAAMRSTAGLVLGTDIYSKAAVDAGFQPLDSDLTAIAGLAPTNDDVVQRKAGAWTNRTLAQLLTDLAALGTTFQPLDSDLTAIAALTTTAFGRGLLALADAAALRSSAGLVLGTDIYSKAAVDSGFQPLDADLTDLVARWVAASATGPASLDFAEDTDNGTNRARVIAPAALGADRTLTLPDETGTLVTTAGATFTGDIIVPAEVYGAGWNGSNEAPTKNDVYDKIETITGGGASLGDWSALGNLGATETVTGVDDTFVRSAGTLDQACTITIATTANQVIDLQLTQDATGLRAVTFSGVDVWHTVSGTAPVTADRLAGAVDRFYFEDIAGTCHGYWLTETLVVPRQFTMASQWYPANPTAGATTALTAGFPYFEPFFVSERMTLEAAGVYVQTAAASSTIVAAVYNDDDGGYPGTRLLDVNSGSPWSGASSTTFVSTTGLSTVLEPGLYWMGYLALTANPTIATTSGHVPGTPVVGTPTGAASNLRETTGGRTSLPTDVSAYAFTGVANTAFFWLRRS